MPRPVRAWMSGAVRKLNSCAGTAVTPGDQLWNRASSGARQAEKHRRVGTCAQAVSPLGESAAREDGVGWDLDPTRVHGARRLREEKRPQKSKKPAEYQLSGLLQYN